MKKLLLTLTISGSFIFCEAQYYNTVIVGNNSHFSYVDANQPGKVFYHSISIDSVSVLFNGQDMFNFLSFGDTAGGCLHANRNTWIASKIFRGAFGEEYFLNRNGDTIHFKPLAVLNDTWHFYNYPNGNYIEGTLTDISQQTFIGITDSVKTITLNARNSSGNPISNIMNGKQVKISRSHGFVQTLGYRYFPADSTTYPLVGLDNEQAGITNLTARDIYDFNVGDEFHYNDYYQWDINWHERRLYIYKVLAKVFSSDSDSVCYIMDRCGQYDYVNGSTHTITPVHDTYNSIYVFSNDYWETAASLSQFSWQYNDVYYPSKGYLSYYSDTTYHGRIKKQTHYYYDNPWDTCYELVVGSCIYQDRTFVKGLGLAHETDPWCSDGGLVYYKKGSEEWGSPLSCSVLLAAEDISAEITTKLYPNPFTNELIVRSRAGDVITIFDYTGQQILRTTSNAEETVLNTEGLAAGMYFLRVEDKNGIRNFKVVKQ